MYRCLVALALLLAVSACGGGGGAGSNGGSPALPPAHGQTAAKFVISIPHGATTSARKPNLLTPQTATIELSVVSIDGVPPTYTIPTLTVHLNDPAYCTTSGSSTTCTISYSVPIATNVVVALTTFDSSGNKIGSGTLSVDTTQPTIPPTTVAIGGVPASAKFIQSPVVLPDDGISTSITAIATLDVYDADNNLLISPATYGGPVTIASANDTNGALTFPQPSISAPDGTTGASNTVGILFNGTKALGASTAITASYNGKVLATVPVVALDYAPSALPNLVMGGSAQTITLSEANYAGAFTVTGNGLNLSYTCSPVNCTPPAAGGKVSFTFTPNAPGSGTLTFSDSTSGEAYVNFAVTGQSGGTITISNYKVYLYSPPTANSQPVAIGAGPDGKSVWFAEDAATALARIDTSSCVDTSTPPSCTINEEPNLQDFSLQMGAVVSGNDGNVYVTNSMSGGDVVQLQTAGSACVTTQPMTCTAVPEAIPTSAPFPGNMVRGNDGNIYFVDEAGSANNIWSFNPSASSIVMRESFFSSTPAWQFGSMTLDATNTFWVTDNADAMIGSEYRACGDCGLTLQEYGGFIASTSATPTFSGMTTGNDGNIWVIEEAANDIAYFNPTSCAGTTCTVNRIPIPSANAGAIEIAQGTDGNMWFTELNTGKLGIVTGCPAACRIVELTVGSPTSGPAGITAGPDGNMWFTLGSSGQVGKVVP